MATTYKIKQWRCFIKTAPRISQEANEKEEVEVEEEEEKKKLDCVDVRRLPFLLSCID
jgi:hypothetical protein